MNPEISIVAGTRNMTGTVPIDLTIDLLRVGSVTDVVAAAAAVVVAVVAFDFGVAVVSLVPVEHVVPLC